MKRCFFIGHRDAPACVREGLFNTILEVIERHGNVEFVVGKYGAFDRMAAQAVREIRAYYPHIRLVLLTPYHPAMGRSICPEEFDGVFYPFERPVPPRFAIVQANKKAIDTSDYLIVYVRHPGKARDFREYAQRRMEKGRLEIYQL